MSTLKPIVWKQYKDRWSWSGIVWDGIFVLPDPRMHRNYDLTLDAFIGKRLVGKLRIKRYDHIVKPDHKYFVTYKNIFGSDKTFFSDMVVLDNVRQVVEFNITERILELVE